MASTLPKCEVEGEAAGLPEVDDMFATLGEAKGLPVVALETVDEQIAAIAATPPKLAAQMIVASARSPELDDDAYVTLLTLYQQKRPARAIAVIDAVPGISDEDRNRRTRIHQAAARRPQRNDGEPRRAAPGGRRRFHRRRGAASDRQERPYRAVSRDGLQRHQDLVRAPGRRGPRHIPTSCVELVVKPLTMPCAALQMLRRNKKSAAMQRNLTSQSRAMDPAANTFSPRRIGSFEPQGNRRARRRSAVYAALAAVIAIFAALVYSSVSRF